MPLDDTTGLITAPAPVKTGPTMFAGFPVEELAKAVDDVIALFGPNGDGWVRGHYHRAEVGPRPPLVARLFGERQEIIDRFCLVGAIRQTQTDLAKREAVAKAIHRFGLPEFLRFHSTTYETDSHAFFNGGGLEGFNDDPTIGWPRVCQALVRARDGLLAIA